MSSHSELFRTKLVVYYEFIASHSLDIREEPHPHRWETVLTFTGKMAKGRIVNFPDLEAAIREDFASLPESYLNENPDLLPEGRAFPTCETVGASLYIRLRERTVPRFRSENPTLAIDSVQVKLWEGDRAYGAAIIERPRLSLGIKDGRKRTS